VKAIALAAVLGASALLAGCGESSEPFALRDGCYYAEDGKPILRVRGEEGTILTPDPAPGPNRYTPVHRVHLNPRVDRHGAYVEVSPGFYLTGSNRAATSSPTSRFTIDTHTTPAVIMVNMEAWGEAPVHLGKSC
jgi:hypothetical protein